MRTTTLEASSSPRVPDSLDWDVPLTDPSGNTTGPNSDQQAAYEELANGAHSEVSQPETVITRPELTQATDTLYSSNGYLVDELESDRIDRIDSWLERRRALDEDENSWRSHAVRVQPKIRYRRQMPAVEHSEPEEAPQTPLEAESEPTPVVADPEPETVITDTAPAEVAVPLRSSNGFSRVETGTIRTERVDAWLSGEQHIVDLDDGTEGHRIRSHRAGPGRKPNAAVAKSKRKNQPRADVEPSEPELELEQQPEQEVQRLAEPNKLRRLASRVGAAATYWAWRASPATIMGNLAERSAAKNAEKASRSRSAAVLGGLAVAVGAGMIWYGNRHGALHGTDHVAQQHTAVWHPPLTAPDHASVAAHGPARASLIPVDVVPVATPDHVVAETRQALAHDPSLHGGASNATGWSRQALESAARNSGLSPDDITKLTHNQQYVDQVNSALYADNPSLSDHANPQHWLSANQTYNVQGQDAAAQHIVADYKIANHLVPAQVEVLTPAPKAPVPDALPTTAPAIQEVVQPAASAPHSLMREIEHTFNSTPARLAVATAVGTAGVLGAVWHGSRSGGSGSVSMSAENDPEPAAAAKKKKSRYQYQGRHRANTTNRWRHAQ